MGFTTDGIGIIRNPEEGELQGLELLAVLTEINLTQTQNSAGLTLEAKQGESLLVTPVLSGNGNLLYTGAGVFTVDDYLIGETDDINTYSGNTYVVGNDSENRLTLNLLKQQSLGKTQFLFAQNALINVAGGKETVNGDAEFQNTKLVLTGDNNRLEILGDASFRNSEIESSAQTYEGAGGLYVSGKLSIYSSNADTLSGSVVAGLAFLADVLALGKADLYIQKAPDEINAEVALSLTGGEKQFDTAIYQFGTGDDFTVRIDNRSQDLQNRLFLTYGLQDIDAAATEIDRSVKLTVTGTNQLGSTVSLQGDAESNAVLEIKKSGSESSWSIDDIELISEYAEDVVEVNGQGFSLNNAQVLDGYAGWLRLSNTEFALNTTNVSLFGNQAGLSLGANSKISVTGADTVNVNRLAWTTDLESGEKGGILDLTGFTFSGDASHLPALHVTNLELNGIGSVQVDVSSITGNYSPDTPLLDADNGAQNIYQIISADNIVGDATNITVPTDHGTTGVDIKSASGTGSTVIATGQWGFNVSSELEGDDKGLWLSYDLLSIELKNAAASVSDDYLTFNLSNSTDKTLSARLTGEGVAQVITSRLSDTFNINNRENDFTGRLIIGSNITANAEIGALGKGGLIVQLEDGANLSLNRSDADTSEENRTQHLTDLQLNGTDTHTISIGENSILALDLGHIADHEHSWDNVNFAGQGTLRLTQGELTLQNATTAVDPEVEFSGRIQIDEAATLNLVDDNQSPGSLYQFHYLYGSGTVGVGVNALAGHYEGFTGTYAIKNGKTLRVEKDSEISEASFNLESGSTLVYAGADDFGRSVALLGDASINFISTSGTFTTLTDNNHELTVSAVDQSHITFDQGSSTDIYTQNIESASSLTYEFAGGQDYAFDLSKTSDSGRLWFDFAQPANLSLTAAGDSFSGIFGYRNATLAIGSGKTLGNKINQFGLQVGGGSTLANLGQTTFSKNLIFDDGSTLDLTSSAAGSASGGLDANGIQLDAGAHLTVNGGVNVLYDTTDIEVSISEDVTADPFLDALDKATHTVVNIIEGIRLEQDQTAEDLAANFMLNGNQQTFATVAIDQNNVHVADVSTGLGIVATTESDGSVSLGIGGAVTTLTLLDGRELAIDVQETNKLDTPRIAAQITGSGSLKFINGREDGNPDIIVSSANNSYTGSTIIADGTHVKSVNSNAFGRTGLLQVGLAEGTGATESTAGTLTLQGTSGDLDQYVSQLLVQKDGLVNLVATQDHYAHIHIASDSADSDQQSIIRGKIVGADNSQLWAQNSAVLTIDRDADMSEFMGTFVGTGSAVIRYEYEDNENWDFKTDFTDSIDSVLAFAGSGVVNVLNDSDGKLSLRAESGTINLSAESMRLQRLEVQSGSTVQVNGLLTVSGDLKASAGSVLEMDVALGSGTEASSALAQNGNDGLLVQGSATGTLGVHLVDRNRLQKGQEESIKLIQVDGDATQFSAHLVDDRGSIVSALTAGGYDYVLLAQDHTVQTTQRDVATGTDYVLSSVTGAADKRNTTVTAGSYIGISYAAQLFDVSLHDRVGNRDWINPVTGEKQSTSLWLRHDMSHERYRDSTAQLRMRTTSNVTMLGGDLVQLTSGETGLSYFGLMGGYGSMDTKTHSKATNLTSKAETDAWGAGAYAGWKANSDGMTGPYVDGWLMFTHADSDMTGADRVKENIKGQGLSASIEAGWGFKVGSVTTDNGKIANFVIEPHASATWFGMEYDDIHDEAQDIRFEGKNNVRTRLGARAIISEEGNADFNAFVEANWVHNTQEYGATLSGLRVDQAGSSNLGEACIGVDWRLTQGLSVWGRVGAAFGSDAYNEREGSVGIRYQF